MIIRKIKNLLLFNRFYCYSEYRVLEFIKKISRTTAKNSDFLDLGAGESRFKKYFIHTNYLAQDSCVGDENWDYSSIDINSEIYNIPVKDKSFDYILCTEVLEHLKRPHLAFKEFSRILKSGGELFIVSPFAWKEHQKPNDFFRYTKFALMLYAEENNFKIKELREMGGKYITIGQLFNDLNVTIYFTEKTKSKFIMHFMIMVFYPIKFFIGFVCYYLDKIDRNKDLTLQYEAIFIKK